MKKVLLAILDGFGINDPGEYNAVSVAKTPNLDALSKQNPHSILRTSGLAVGLPEGQMGNSEVGHLNLGAGRIVYQELTRITKSITDGDFFTNEAFMAAVENVKKHHSKLHILGLISDGGVHSSDIHYKAMLKLAKRYGIQELYYHCFMDGRDTPPKSGAQYIKELEDAMQQEGVGKIATVSGRYYAMDRDKRYDRIQLAYDAMTIGKGEKAQSAVAAMENAYAKEITDEFVLPTVIMDGEHMHLIEENDSVIFINFRPDRARQITKALTQPDFDGFVRSVIPKIVFVSMTQYEDGLKNVLVAFKPQTIKNTLGEYVASKGLTQLRIAETEKYAHVTYFFNGGVEAVNANEDRELIPSPKVATYDLQPQMSAYLVTDKLKELIPAKGYDLIVLNFANCDMVGHTGVLDAAVKAVEAVDECIGQVVSCARENGYSVIITADHGNAERMREDDGVTPFTAHTTLPVPIIVIDDDVQGVKEGILANVAPTILDLMGLEKPAEMDQESLLIK